MLEILACNTLMGNGYYLQMLMTFILNIYVKF